MRTTAEIRKDSKAEQGNARSRTGPGLTAEPRQGTAKPGHWQWPAMDTADDWRTTPVGAHCIRAWSTHTVGEPGHGKVCGSGSGHGRSRWRGRQCWEGLGRGREAAAVAVQGAGDGGAGSAVAQGSGARTGGGSGGWGGKKNMK